MALIIFGFSYGMSKKRLTDVSPCENGSLVTLCQASLLFFLSVTLQL